MLRYLGSDEYEFHTSDNKVIYMSKNDIEELMVVATNEKIFCPSIICKDYSAKKKVLEDIEEYANSIDNDINTINNFDMGCCDEREAETLRNVFNYLDKLIKKHKPSGSKD